MTRLVFLRRPLQIIQLNKIEMTSWSVLELFPDLGEIRILDVGAALHTEPPYQSLVDIKRARVIGFEPNEEECARLNRLYGATHAFFPHFLGDGDDAIFHETNWALTGSLLEPNKRLLEKFGNLAEVTTKVAEHRVPTKRADDIPEIGDIDFFKIDVQGAELAVFENATRILGDTLVIQTEVEFVELYMGQPLFSDVDRFLRSHGFAFHTFDGFGMRPFKPLVRDGDPNLGIRQYLWSDAIYVRSWLDLDLLSNEKLMRYAVILHDVLASHDLAYVVLSELESRIGGGLTGRYIDRISSGAIDQERSPGKSGFGRDGARRAINAGDCPTGGVDDVKQIVVQSVLGQSLVVPDNLDSLSTYILLEQETWFEPELGFLAQFADIGMKIVDVGANIGVYSIPMAARIGESGKAWAFEPGLESKECLMQGAKLNGLDNLTISGRALSSEAGSGWLGTAWSDELRTIGFDRTVENEGSHRVDVSTLDLEAQRYGWSGVDFVKIDAEGMEARIIAGGKAFFQNESPLVMYEIKSGGNTNQELRWMFELLGYRTLRLNGDGQYLSPLMDGEAIDRYAINLFAAKPDRIANLVKRELLVIETRPFEISIPERDSIIQRMVSLPFAVELEVGPDDFGGGSAYCDALIAYGFYRFGHATVARRHAALEYSFRKLRDICASEPSVARLATFVRVALSAHQKGTALAALESLRAMFDISANKPNEIDEIFLPVLERYECIRIGDRAHEWLASSVLEAIELVSAFSSRFGGLHIDVLKKLCDSQFATSELVRRWVLKSVREGIIPDRPAFSGQISGLNERLWSDGDAWIPGILEIAGRQLNRHKDSRELK